MDRIEDIVEETVDLRAHNRNDLLRGTMVLRNQVADVLNLRSVLAHAQRHHANGG